MSDETPRPLTFEVRSQHDVASSTRAGDEYEVLPNPVVNGYGVYLAPSGEYEVHRNGQEIVDPFSSPDHDKAVAECQRLAGG